MSATVRTMAIAGGVVAIVVVLPAVLFPVLVEAQPTIEGIRYAVSGTLEPLALVLSIAAAAGLRNNLGLRAGGYLSAGLLAIVANSGWHVLMIGLVAVLSHIAVARVAKGRLLLAGRSAMTLHLLVAGLFGWAGLLLAHRVGGSAAAAVSGLAAIPLLMMDVHLVKQANDF